MDPQIEKFLNDFADKTLFGPGFIAFAPKEKEELKVKLLGYFSDLIFDTLLQNLNETQLKELDPALRRLQEWKSQKTAT